MHWQNNPYYPHPSKQQPYEIFRTFRGFRGQKWVVYGGAVTRLFVRRL